MPFRLIIAGSRSFNDYQLLRTTADALLANKTDVEIVSGRCDRGVHTFTTDEGIKVFGADGLGERYSKEKGYSVKPFPADWETHGRKAGPLRNKEMSRYGQALLAFWDGASRGAANMIELAKAAGLAVRVKRY